MSSRTRTEKSPCAKRRAAAVISSRGSAIFLETTSESTSARKSTASVTAKKTQMKALQAPMMVERSVLTKMSPTGAPESATVIAMAKT